MRTSPAPNAVLLKVCRHYSLELRSYCLAWLALSHLEQTRNSAKGKTQPTKAATIDGISHSIWSELVESIGRSSAYHSHINHVFEDSALIEGDGKSRWVCTDPCRRMDLELSEEDEALSQATCG